MTREEIRAAQEEALAAVEAQLDSGAEKILVAGRWVERESAWAATQALRKAFELGGRYDGQELAGDGTWLARIQIPLGRFPG
jgi:hypothetical protein